MKNKSVYHTDYKLVLLNFGSLKLSNINYCLNLCPIRCQSLTNSNEFNEQFGSFKTLFGHDMLNM